MDVQQRIAWILQQIHEAVLRPNDAHERLVRARFARYERIVGVLGFAGVRAPRNHPAHANDELDVVAELLFEVTVVRLQLTGLDADGELQLGRGQ